MARIEVHCSDCGTAGEIVDRFSVHLMRNRGGFPEVSPVVCSQVVRKRPCRTCQAARAAVAKSQGSN